MEKETSVIGYNDRYLLKIQQSPFEAFLKGLFDAKVNRHLLNRQKKTGQSVRLLKALKPFQNQFDSLNSQISSNYYEKLF